MNKLKLIVFLVTSVIILLLVLQNTEEIRAHFLWFSAGMPAIVLLFLTTVGGFILGLLVALIIRSSRKDVSHCKGGSDDRKRTT